MDARIDQLSPKDPQSPVAGRRAQDAAPTAMLLRYPGWMVAAVLLIAFNLRPSITTVALFIADIKHDLSLSTLGLSETFARMAAASVIAGALIIALRR